MSVQVTLDIDDILAAALAYMKLQDPSLKSKSIAEIQYFCDDEEVDIETIVLTLE